MSSLEDTFSYFLLLLFLLLHPSPSLASTLFPQENLASTSVLDLSASDWRDIEAGRFAAGNPDSWLVLFYSGSKHGSKACRAAAKQLKLASKELSGTVRAGAVDCDAALKRGPASDGNATPASAAGISSRINDICFGAAGSKSKRVLDDASVGTRPIIMTVAPSPKTSKPAVKPYRFAKKGEASAFNYKKVAKFAREKLLSGAIVTTLGPPHNVKGVSVHHMEKITDFVVDRDTISIPKALFFLTKGSLGKVPTPPLLKALSLHFRGRMLFGQISPAQLTIRKMYLESPGRFLEPPAVLVLPAGAASAEKAVVFSGKKLERGALEIFLEEHALPVAKRRSSMHGKKRKKRGKAKTYKTKVKSGKKKKKKTNRTKKKNPQRKNRREL